MLLLLSLTALTTGLQAQSRYEISCDKRVFDKSLEILNSLEGTIEKTGKNDGEKIFEIQTTCGIPKKAAYCNATQYFTFFEAVKALNLTTKAIPIPKNGLAQSSFNYAKKVGKKTEYFAEVGDLLVWKRGNTAKGHIERVVEVRQMGWVITLGGNVSSGKKEGIFKKKRNIANPLSKLLSPKGLVSFNVQ
jgi:hypothetical protein